MRRWTIAIPNKLAGIAHTADRHPEPGVADIRVPMDIARRQRLPWAPVMGNREIVSGLGLGGAGGQADNA